MNEWMKKKGTKQTELKVIKAYFPRLFSTTADGIVKC